MSTVGLSSSVPSISSTPPTVLKKDTFSVQLNEKAYSERLTLCGHSLIARVILSKGEAPWKLQDLKMHLTAAWFLQNWKLISLGEEFHQVFLCLEEDNNSV